jgi:hypothetical protein
MSKSWLLIFCLVAASGRAQATTSVLTDVAPSPSNRFPADWYPADNDVTYTSAAQRGEPYSATLVITYQVRNPDGTTKSVNQSGLQARDGAGRKREEMARPRPDGQGGVIMAHEVSVNDPVSHCSFRWMDPWVGAGTPTAFVTCMPRTLHYIEQDIYADAVTSQPQEVSSAMESDTTDRSEPLGKRQIEGFDATGVRRTRTKTTPGGTTVVLTTEIWYSQELQELLELRQTLQPEAHPGEGPLPDFKLTQIHRGEPDEKLFYPPDGYKIEPES